MQVFRIARRWLPVLCAAGAAACGNDDGGPVLEPGMTTCPPDQANWAYIHGVVSQPLCANAGCHAGAGVANSGNLDLSGTPVEVHARLVGVATRDAEGAAQYPLRIEASSSTTSYFLHMVESDGPLGSSLGRMPPGGRLSNCDIAALSAWIDAGADL